MADAKVVSPEAFDEICRLLNSAVALQDKAKGPGLNLQAKLALLNEAKALRAKAMEIE